MHDDEGFADLVLSSSAPAGSLDGIRRLHGSQHCPAPGGTPFAAEQEQVLLLQDQGSGDKVRLTVPTPPRMGTTRGRLYPRLLPTSC